MSTVKLLEDCAERFNKVGREKYGVIQRVIKEAGPIENGVPERRNMVQDLQDGVEVAGVSEIEQAWGWDGLMKIVGGGMWPEEMWGGR